MAGKGFAGYNPEVQVVLFGGKDAGGEVCEGAGRVVGFVEVDEDVSIRFHVCDQVAAGGVALIFTGGVPKADEERAVVLFVDVQLIIIFAEFKR